MNDEIRIREHPRARRMTLRVRADTRVEVTVPPGIGAARVLRFVEQHRAWIERARERVRAERRPAAERGPFPERLELVAEARRVPVTYVESERDGWRWTEHELVVRLYRREAERARAALVGALKQRARGSLQLRLEALADRHDLRYARVSWRNQKSRWGSCSSRGSISLNVRLLFLPLPLVDYVLVHELAHLRHPDHSAAFWRFVGGMLPDYRDARRLLKRAAVRVPEWLL